MTISITASADYDLGEAMFLMLMVEPPIAGVRHGVVQESLRTTPVPRCTLEKDIYGNPQRRVQAPKGFFTFDFNATIEYAPFAAPPRDDEDAPGNIAGFLYDAETLLYTLPSRFCPSDLLVRMAQEKFGDAERGMEQVTAVAEWVNRRIEYRPDRNVFGGTAADTVTQRTGGRHDVAHLVVAFCRALGIPARYVSGYALGLEPNDFHAWAQVWVGNAWQDVDATAKRPLAALVPIAVGRDAADVPLFQGWGKWACRDKSVFVERVR